MSHRERTYTAPGENINVHMEEGPFDQLDMTALNCTNVTLNVGDRLYLPFGTIHRAKAGSTASVHATFELEAKGLTWGDLVLSAANITKGHSLNVVPKKKRHHAEDEDIVEKKTLRMLANALQFNPGVFQCMV